LKDNNIAILLARLDSQRLPKKHFEKIGEFNLITHCLNRLKLGKNYTIVLATSDREIDDPLIEWAQESGVNYYRGSAYDLKERIKGCVVHFDAEYFARVNADSPFIDSSLIDQGFDFLRRSNFDLYTNLYPRTFPYGYSVEVFNSKSFINEIDQNKELENITTYFYTHSEKFRIKNLCLENEDYSKLELTVDTPDDLEKMRTLYSKNNQLFNLPLEQLIQLIKKNKK
jgi:spore coat polysaccharide biosynthesis protein SpsF